MTDFNDMLKFDGLAEAEKLTGKSYKDDKDTMGLGMALHMLHGQQVKDELALRDDTYYSIPFSDALAIYYDLGFVDAYSTTYELRGEVNSHIVLVHSDGIIMNITSYGSTLNSATMYYNWEHEAPVDGERHPMQYVESGHYISSPYDAPERRWVWSGSHDARVGIRHSLDRLRSNGKFLPIWEEKPFIWFLNPADERKDSDTYKAVNERVIAAMTPAVQEMING